jgi:hypothetical protein
VEGAAVRIAASDRVIVLRGKPLHIWVYASCGALLANACQALQSSALGASLQHVLRPHPLVELFIGQVPQLQRRLAQVSPSL